MKKRMSKHNRGGNVMGKVLAINAGSSSLKFQLFEMPEERVLAKGLIERIGFSGSVFTIETDSVDETLTKDMSDHEEAVQLLLSQLLSSGVIKSYDEIEAVGHRVVHGGEYFRKSDRKSVV